MSVPKYGCLRASGKRGKPRARARGLARAGMRVESSYLCTLILDRTTYMQLNPRTGSIVVCQPLPPHTVYTVQPALAMLIS